MARRLTASVEVNDLWVFEQLLNDLGKKESVKIVRKSQRVAARAMLKATRAAAPVDTGLLAKSLKVLALKRKPGRIGFRVGYKNVDQIVAKSKWSGKRGFYPAFVEYGTVRMHPRPFMRPAFDKNKEQSKRLIVDTIRTGIIAAATRLMK